MLFYKTKGSLNKAECCSGPSIHPSIFKKKATQIRYDTKLVQREASEMSSNVLKNRYKSLAALAHGKEHLQIGQNEKPSSKT